MTPGASSLQIPDAIRAKFPTLLELILGSESMNDEERQYWINILPVMTPEQITDLTAILENEKRQLQAIDARYAKEIDKIGQAELIRRTEEERRKRRNERQEKEAAHEATEEVHTEEILKHIEGEN